MDFKGCAQLVQLRSQIFDSVACKFNGDCLMIQDRICDGFGSPKRKCEFSTKQIGQPNLVKANSPAVQDYFSQASTLVSLHHGLFF